jgi:hypothetical protein
MRRTSFTVFLSIAFPMVVGSAQAGDVPASELTEQQHSTPRSPSDLSKALEEVRALTKQQSIIQFPKVLGCDVPRRPPTSFRACSRDDRACELGRFLNFSDCPPDDRRCEVVIKMRGCVIDDVMQRRSGTPRF